jgi:hypothetical protein
LKILGFLSLVTVPALYERYESEVDHLAVKGNKDAKKLYEKFDANVLNKIPRGLGIWMFPDMYIMNC